MTKKKHLDYEAESDVDDGKNLPKTFEDVLEQIGNIFWIFQKFMRRKFNFFKQIFVQVDLADFKAYFSYLCYFMRFLPGSWHSFRSLWVRN